MVLTHLLVAGLLAAVSAHIISPENIDEVDRMLWTNFNSFAKKYNRNYGSDMEVFKRFLIYKDNIELSKTLQETEMGTATYGETRFSDMTPEEFKKTMHPLTWPKQTNPQPIDIEKFGVSTKHLPKSIDWRKKGVVTKIKNQGDCGSCWAFSTIANIEGVWAIAKGKLVSLSEQEVVDCDSEDDGCDGGLPTTAYQEIIKTMGGLETEDNYPYNGGQGSCDLNKKKFAVYINDSVQLPSDEAKMVAWIATKGPLSVGLNADPLQLYTKGILHPSSIACPVDGVDHAVLIVGYGTEHGKPYWIIKNSWGADWGEKGYFRLYRGTNVCGINTLPTSAIVK